MPKNKRINLVILALVLLPLLVLSTQAFGQGSSATLSGTVTDTSQAVLPGATVKATSSQTGVVTTTTTNNAGVYNFPSLQPGVYQVSATMKGFQTVTRTDVRLGLGAQSRLNVELPVAAVATEVEVVTTAETMVLESGSSTGTVLQEDLVSDLPIVGNDVMDLINVMGGVVRAEDPIFGNSTQSFAGVNASNINIQRDGISVSEIRYNSGIVSPSRMNTELVGEFKLVLSPVDAEMGRGAGQVQMITKSGANAFHGSGVWNIQNTALDAYEFENKDQARVTPREWRNLHNYTLSLSGPVIKNKTFFFANWDQQTVKTKSSYVTTVLTGCARKGIYRWLDGITGTNAAAQPSVPSRYEFNPATFAYDQIKGLQRPVVDYDGNPLTTYTWPNDTTTYGSLAGVSTTNEVRYQNVLGALSGEVPDVNGNCEGYTVPNSVFATSWDNYRNQVDQSGFVNNFSSVMPMPNDYQSGDGLNTAGFRWTRTTKGRDTVFGSGMDNLRKAITVKIDHNINSSHRLSGTYSYESDNGDDSLPYWPESYNGYGGLVDRQPQTFTVSLTSTLRPTLLNEFRMGLSRTRTHTNDPLNNPKTGEKLKQVLYDLLPTTAENGFGNYEGYPILAGPGTGSMLFHPEGGNGHPFGSLGNIPTTWGGVDPRWTFSDTITWMKGAHSFKGGFEFRRQKSWQEANGLVSFSGGANTYPSIKGGTLTDLSPYRDSALSSVTAAPYWPGIASSFPGQTKVYDQDRTSTVSPTGNYTNVYSLMTYMSGAIGDVSQFFYVTDANNPRWNRPGDGELNYVTDLRNREFAFFFKDDWKVNSSLTLNLGMRYEYYGVPWEETGLTHAIKDGVAGMFGASGGDFDSGTFMAEDPAMTSYRTEPIYVGPNSMNPNISVFEKDKNNFAPHVGFAWQLPWFGKGKTTLRGGYSISYSAVSNFDNTFGYGKLLSNQPGMTYAYHYKGDAEHPYLNFDNIGSVFPLPLPENAYVAGTGGTEELWKMDQGLTILDPNIRNPYIQNLSLSLTRNIGNNLTVDVRYVGTLSRKSVSGLNLNTVNFINNGLMDELNLLRTALTADQLNSTELFPILNTYVQPGTLFVPLQYGVIPVMNLSGANQVLHQYAQNIANGNFSAVAGSLATANFDVDAHRAAPSSWEKGQVLEFGNSPANLIYTNPQFSSATINHNQGRSNYHSMQAQVTMRPVRGLSFQTSYTWSRNMATAGYSDYTDMSELDRYLSGSHRSHQLTSYGTWTLPFGANGFIFRNASGAFKKTIEGWQLGWIASATSGSPMSIGSVNTGLWGNAQAVLEEGQSFDTKAGKAQWDEGAVYGNYFGNRYSRTTDPICNSLPNTMLPYDSSYQSLRAKCTGSSGLRALVDTQQLIGYNGTTPIYQTILRNPGPGENGNFGRNNLTGTGRWSLDMNMTKAIEFMEGKRIEFRVDAQNIFNHAAPSYNAWKGFGSYETSAQTNARFTSVTNPPVDLNSAWTPFGQINSKAGHRTFQAKIRISF